MNRIKITIKACRANDPPIELGQVWSARSKEGKILRSIRIVALYDFPTTSKRNTWIVEDIYPKTGYLRRCDEFNLRYVFELDQDQE
jgi:hypothetical protein